MGSDEVLRDATRIRLPSLLLVFFSTLYFFFGWPSYWYEGDWHGPRAKYRRDDVESCSFVEAS